MSAEPRPAEIPPLDTSKAPEPELRPHALDGSRYTSREFMESEWDRMWTREASTTAPRSCKQ